MKHRHKNLFIDPAGMASPAQKRASGRKTLAPSPSDSPPATSRTAQSAGPFITGAAGATPETHGTPAFSHAAFTNGSSGADTGQASQQSAIDVEVSTVIAGIGCNARTGQLMLDAWRAYRSFADPRGTLPARLAGITPADLTRFVAQARRTQEDADELLMMLTMLGGLHGGHDRGVTSALIAAARRIRMRMRNASNGKYNHENRLVEPLPEAHTDAGNRA